MPSTPSSKKAKLNRSSLGFLPPYPERRVGARPPHVLELFSAAHRKTAQTVHHSSCSGVGSAGRVLAVSSLNSRHDFRTASLPCSGLQQCTPLPIHICVRVQQVTRSPRAQGVRCHAMPVPYKAGEQLSWDEIGHPFFPP